MPPTALQRFWARLLGPRKISLPAPQLLEAVVEELPPPQSRPWTDLQLEAAIEAAPDDRAAWVVWADALLEHGEARGELIVAEHSGGGLAEVWRRLRPTLLGALDPEVSEGKLELQWAHGLVSGARISSADPARTTRQLLDLPIARFLQALSYEELRTETSPVMEALASSVRGQQLRSLSLVGPGASWASLSLLPTAAPRLERLELQGGNRRWLKKPEPFLLAELRSLVLRFEGLSSGGLRNISAVQVPRLERFELSMGTYDGEWDGPIELDDLRPWALGQGLEGVTHFGLTDSSLTAGLLEVLSTSPLTPRLRVLDLSRGTLRGGDVDALIARADCFLHLERLDLSENLLDDRAVARLAERLPNVRLERQRA